MARREGTTRRGRFISESRSPDYTPLPHNEMLARTYSASNFGSTIPLANQITALSSPKATNLIARPRPKEMIGRRLSQEEAKRLLAKFCLRNLCGGNVSAGSDQRC